MSILPWQFRTLVSHWPNIKHLKPGTSKPMLVSSDRSCARQMENMMLIWHRLKPFATGRTIQMPDWLSKSKVLISVHSLLHSAGTTSPIKATWETWSATRWRNIQTEHQSWPPQEQQPIPAAYQTKAVSPTQTPERSLATGPRWQLQLAQSQDRMSLCLTTADPRELCLFFCDQIEIIIFISFSR